MANNDYFSVTYKILSYLKYCYKHGEQPDPSVLQASTFNISQRQFYQTLQMLTDDSYLKGLKFTITKTEIIVGGLDQLSITSNGL